MRVFLPIAFSMFAATAGSVSAAEITVTLGDASTPSLVTIRGSIEPGDGATFASRIGGLDRALVMLESPGGSVDDGLSIGADIRTKGFTTLVAPNAGCYSICAIIWVSGASRMMDRTSSIGVHAAYRNQAMDDGSSMSLESGMANADIGAFLNMIGLSREAIRYFTAASPEDLLSLSPEMAQRLSIDTAVSDGNVIQWPKDRPTPNRITAQVSEYAGMSTNCSELFSLDPAWLESQMTAVLEQGHALFGGELFADTISRDAQFQKNQIEAMGRWNWCIEAERSLRAGNRMTGITGPSYDCAKASTITERTICSTPDLWASDRAVGYIFNIVHATGTKDEKRTLNQRQRAWQARRNACGDDVLCLNERYDTWLSEFTHQ